MKFNTEIFLQKYYQLLTCTFIEDKIAAECDNLKQSLPIMTCTCINDKPKSQPKMESSFKAIL